VSGWVRKRRATATPLVLLRFRLDEIIMNILKSILRF
jgi:hypothetical protein